MRAMVVRVLYLFNRGKCLGECAKQLPLISINQNVIIHQLF